MMNQVHFFRELVAETLEQDGFIVDVCTFDIMELCFIQFIAVASSSFQSSFHYNFCKSPRVDSTDKSLLVHLLRNSSSSIAVYDLTSFTLNN